MATWTDALWLLATVQLVKCVPLESMFAYGESAGDTSLGGYDDHSSPAIKLSLPVHYYGRQYDAVYVNDNGLLSFLTELPNFHNVPFPLDYPLIAAFYSDVDVRGAGAVYYRLTTQSDLLDTFNMKISDSFSEGASFQAEQLLIVTWSQVGYFDSNTDKRNTFQVILGWSGDDTFLMMLYADDGLQWIAGDGKIQHQPDARAQAGVISGDGRYTMLPFSGADQVQHLDEMSNCGQGGLFLFRVGVIEDTQDAAPPDIYFEEDGSGSGDTCATSGIMCHTYSTCDDYLDGFCCSCDSGYYGNGISCLTTEEPVRVMGRVSGELNGASIGEQSMQSYAVVKDGRCYTSLTKIPPSPGFDLQTLNAINDVVAWMFAKPGNRSVNGFQLTGGDASVTMYVEFPQTGDRMLISQQFQGVGVYNHINVHTNITGTAPPVYYGSTVHVEDYTNHIITLDTGRIQMRSQRLMRLGENSLFIPVHVTAEVVFSECTHRPRLPRHQHYKHTVGRNFIVYEKPEQIVRFASSNQISVAKGSDACEVTTERCGQFSVCVATDDGGFQCLCSPGYRHSSSGSGISALSVCEDIDECDEGLHCDSNAICSNTLGSYTCSCSTGFTGDGRSCRAVLSCSELSCGENGRCYEPKPGSPQCECDDGFMQDELICFPQTKTVCSSRSDCGPNSDCLYVVWAGGYICQCDVGYTGDGVRCSADTPPAASCNGVRCHPHADCVTDAGAAVCVCNLGLIGDGYTVCQQPPTESHCETSVDCGANAECRLADWLGRKVCMCDAGYVGDGVNCSLATSVVELCNGKRCDLNALCTLENGVQQCACRPSYHGNGIQCQQSSHSSVCSSDSSCGLHSGCVYAPWTGGNTCLCDVGYVRQRDQCVLPNSTDSQLCSKDTDCGAGGRCQYDGSRLRFVCQPARVVAELPTQNADDCYSSFNCSVRAVCVYNADADGFECRCQPGYYGDGYTCTSTTDATSQPTQPTVLEASCVFDLCVCREGYRLTTDSKHCIKIYGTPSPVCYNSACACPDMFVYLRTTNSCLPAASARPEENGVVPHTTPGNPSSSRPKAVSCLSDMECGTNAICDYSAVVDGYVCSCLPGFSLDDGGCVSPANSDCRALNDCHSNALCVFNGKVGRHVCQCQQGFEGDGKNCDQITLGCKLLNNCGLRASCIYVPRRIRYVCQCDQGYTGDGYTCRSQVTCYNDPTMCDRYATCVSGQDGFHCVCRTNYVGNGTSCSPERRHSGGFLLLTQGAAVVKVPFAASVRGRPLVFQPSQTAVGIDTDCISGRFYWTDVAGRKIKSAFQNGSDWLEFASGDIGSPEGVAVDFVSRNVYWTDSTRHRIEVASIATGHRYTLISVGLANVRGVAVHPGRGAIYWADWNRQQPRIEAASLDGSRRRLLLGKQLQLPNSLAVDFDTDQLCWTDAGAKTIDCLSLNSRQRRLLVPAASYPFGIAITDTHIYWTDWNDKRIHALEKASGQRGKSLKSVLGASSKPYGLAVTARSCPLGVTNVCARENGGCASDQLCLPNERYDRTCVCPNTRANDAGPLSPQCQ